MSKFSPTELAIRTDRLAKARGVRAYMTQEKDNKLLTIIYNLNNTTIGDLVKHTDFKRTYLINALRRLMKKELIDGKLENNHNQLRYRYTTKGYIFSGVGVVGECPNE